MNIPEDQRSKEDPAKQTQAVEALLKEVLSSKLAQYSGKVFAVGGFTRDQLLGKTPDDIDIVVDDPEQKMKAGEEFARALARTLNIETPNNPHPLKAEYGIWGVVLFNPKDSQAVRAPFMYIGVDITGYVLEITPPRRETGYASDKREPERVEYTSKEDDARRRDLTINALYKDIATGEIKDYVGGMQDLKNKNLRPPEHPDGIQQIYIDDPLRIWRLIRFSGKLPGFKVDPKTEETIKSFLNSSEGSAIVSDKLSAERIRDELVKILTNPDGNTAVTGLEKMREWGLLKHISPEFDKMLNIYHDTRHTHRGESVWEHTMDVLRATPPTLKARLGALFHDIGKIERVQRIEKDGEPKVQFIGHQDYGVATAEKALKDLKFDGSIINAIKGIVHSHMGFNEESKPSTRLREQRVLIEKMYDSIDDTLAVMRADVAVHPERAQKVDQLSEEIHRLMEEDRKRGFLTDTGKYIQPVSGKVILDTFKYLKQEPALGHIMRKLQTMFLEGRFDNMGEKQRTQESLKAVKGIAGNIIELDKLRAKLVKEKIEEESLRQTGTTKAPPSFFHV